MEYVFSSVQGVAQCLGDLAAINCMYMPYRLPEIYPHILIGKSRREYVYTMDSGAQHILIGKSRRGYVYTMDSGVQHILIGKSRRGYVCTMNSRAQERHRI
jgi:hypothetical protein